MIGARAGAGACARVVRVNEVSGARTIHSHNTLTRTRTRTRTLLFMLVAGCNRHAETTIFKRDYAVTALEAGSSSSMRGVAVVNSRVAWASGAGGVVLRTIDGGASWAVRRVPAADSLDFRDIAAFDSLIAYVLSAGEDGRIYRTGDGGLTWRLQFQNKTQGAFFDCFDFWDARHGIAMSDPVNGRLLLLRTDDGAHWRELPRDVAPAVLPGEAAFAASGTCLVTSGRTRAMIATGGGPQTRVFVTNNSGDSWTATPTPVAAGASSAGIFSLALADPNHAVATGGDYARPAVEASVAVTVDGGRTWSAAGHTAYVSGAAFVRRNNGIVAVGTKGTRVSTDRGMTWRTIDTLEYNAVQFAADGTGYAVGPRGRIARIVAR